MSLIKANAVQIGQSPTATQNFTLAVPSSPDGTIKLARGNSGATTQDVLSVDASGNINGLVKTTGSTTARSLANRFADVVNVKDFGAVGDGVADDTVAIQAAINILGLSGGEVFFPEGHYKITSKIDILFPNVYINGSGKKNTEIFQHTSNSEIFNIVAWYFSISNISLSYNTQGTAGGSAIVIQNGIFYSAIDKVSFDKAYYGVEYKPSSNSHTLCNSNFTDCTASAIYINTAVNILCDSFKIINTDLIKCSLGCIRLFGRVEGCNFVNGQTFQGQYGLILEGLVYSFNNVPQFNKFHCLYLDSSKNGNCLIEKCMETDFIDCWFSTTDENGIYVNNADGVRFTGGGVLNCTKRGALIQSTAKRITFKNFMSRSNSVGSPNVYSGIVFAPNTTDFIVEGCTLTNSVVVYGTQKYGVEVLAGTSDRYIIANNLVSGNGTGGVGDSGTGVNKFVSNNF